VKTASVLLAGILIALSLLPLVPLVAADPPAGSATYVAGATAVVRAQKGTFADQGGAVCGDASGFGGVCIAPAPAVRVTDDALGRNVAFQVCADNDGDGLCTNGQVGPCADQITFSHGDAPFGFSNPVVAPIIQPRSQCPLAVQFLIVFLCNGSVHVDQTGPHVHPATSGTVAGAAVGGPSGNFCGGGGPTGEGNGGAKPYVYVDGDVNAALPGQVLGAGTPTGTTSACDLQPVIDCEAGSTIPAQSFSTPEACVLSVCVPAQGPFPLTPPIPLPAVCIGVAAVLCQEFTIGVTFVSAGNSPVDASTTSGGTIPFGPLAVPDPTDPSGPPILVVCPSTCPVPLPPGVDTTGTITYFVVVAGIPIIGGSISLAHSV
jgi:hypothetical protein